MDFRKGMVCPNCNTHHSFYGGHHGGGINSVNYNCECGFSAILLINWKNEWDHFEVKGIPSASNNVINPTS